MSPTSGTEVGYVFVKDMSDRVAEVNAFYEDERSGVDLLLWLTMIISILVVGVISFFVLSHLIRKRITEPIDKLTATAEVVMEGNLDVEVEVQEGGEFEVLEAAFKEMVESFRNYIAKSVEED
jgi:nitrogen fixation/metabolism regulation signal transduction histidine kinase